MMKYFRIALLLPAIMMFSFFGCGSEKKIEAKFVTITAKEAKQLMDTEKDYVILDVREPNEYQAGHVKNAKLLPLGSIDKMAMKVVPDKNKLLLVYCRSGVRSKKACGLLAAQGYTNVKDFGGIINWPYEVEK